jgi:hypothetical protein
MCAWGRPSRQQVTIDHQIRRLVVSVYQVRLSAVCAAQVRCRIPARPPESGLVLAGGLTPERTLAARESGDRVEVQVEDLGVRTNEAEAELAAENVRRVTASARTLLQSGAGRAATTGHEGETAVKRRLAWPQDAA